jgi:hypothetical protein
MSLSPPKNHAKIRSCGKDKAKVTPNRPSLCLALYLYATSRHVKLQFTDKRVEFEGGHLDLPLPIKDAVRIADRILVIHDYMAYPLQQPAPNLVAYSTSGEHIWTAPNLTRSSPTDAFTNFISEDPLWVGNFEGFNCKIDPQTGALLESVFTK